MANFIKALRRKQRNDFFSTIRGELEIIGSSGGKVFHYEKGENTVVLYAKHSTMHLLTGEVFSNIGTSRATGTDDHVGAGDTLKNSDGTMVSGYQYFDAPNPSATALFPAQRFRSR